MLSINAFDWPGDVVILPPGSTVMHRGEQLTHVNHLDSGRVTLGLRSEGSFVYRVGTLDGPCWLSASCAVLGMTPLVDAVADTEVKLHRVPPADFQATLQALPEAARSVLYDVAQAHHQQAGLAISRLAKDAEARCAEWLLRHAEPAPDDSGAAAAVMLRQRKRLIAEQLGIAPETLSRVLRQLRERSLISGSGQVLNLIDLNGLRALAGA
ncbi:MAG: Crp/Fnr family transcriptional regulator [Burkholderiaceae bacterium]|jgi:CRP-like cAMP-binding protein|nr:Crp/Fnr family transcriptional regulator [Burkholderiaceae bacterium]